MESLGLTVFLLIACLQGAMGATKGLGEDCASGDTCTSTPESVCDNVVKKCLIKQGQSCSVTSFATMCVSGAECDSGTSTCTCKGDVYTADATTGKCTSSSGKWGLACSGGSECTGTDTTCSSGGFCVCVDDKAVDLASGDCTANIVDEKVGKKCTDADKTTTCGAASTHLECPSGGGVCGCATDYFGPLAGDCSPAPGKIGGGCLADGDCKANNDTCASNVCECANGYTADGLDTCNLNPNVVGGSCTVSSGGAYTQGSCTDLNAVCTDTSAGICVCKKGYTGETAGTCEVTPNTSGGSCTTSTANEKGSCTDNNHQCNAVSNGVCNCKTDYQQESGFGCKLKVEISGEDCTASGVVCVDNSMCDSTSKQCKCKTGYKKVGDVCGPADNTLGGSCSGSSCTDSNAECPSSTCSCKTNYGFSEGTCKLKVGISGVDCTTSGNECLAYASCGSNMQCSCNTNFKELNGFCSPNDNKFGGKCTITTTNVGPKGTCADANAMCDYGKCLCKTGYKGTPGGGCVSGASNLMASALVLFLMPAAYLLSTIY